MRDAAITLNRNSLPFDANGPWYTSGLRIGTPALTTLGMGPDEMIRIALIIKTVLANTRASKITKGRNAGTLSKARYRTDEDALQQAQEQVSELLARFPVYPEIDLEFLQQSFG
jgi:glycine hydroxymethyltransferase